jgi:arylsulfatase A-like enzyme
MAQQAMNTSTTAHPATASRKKWLRWSALVIVLLAVALGGFLLAVGGKEGAVLWYVRHVLRTEAAPTQVVQWQQGPSSGAPLGKRPPNIVLIVADDLGYNDITLRGGGIAGNLVPTPNINRIATEGAEFTTGYSGNATCSPSRAALLTGRYPTRVGFEFTSVPVSFSRIVGAHRNPSSSLNAIFHEERVADMPAYEDQGLPTSEISLARLLKGGGYHTVHLGKWHLGENARFSPQAHGFDESLGFMAGASMFLPTASPEVVNAEQTFDPIDRFLWAVHPWQVIHNGGTPFQPPGYLTDYFTDEAVKVVTANRHRPFFLYLAYNAPHTPLQSTREDYDALAGIPDHTRRVYGGMVRSLDRNIGRVLDAIEAQGLTENTLVIFTSDNGGANYIGLEQLNAPYRGWKATFFEGGIRVPYFLRWPRQIAPGTRSTTPAAHLDVFATAAAAAGVAVPTDRIIDGINLLPQVTNALTNGAAKGNTAEQGAPAPQATPPRDLYWRSGSYLAMRSGDWKLQRTENPARSRLFNLATDPTEQHDLAAAEPVRRANMEAQLQRFNAAQAKPLWPSLLEAPIAIDHSLKQPKLPTGDYVYWSN